MDVFYFGDDSHRLFGVLHQPRHQARVGLVFCPPFGEEMTGTYSRLATWAKELAEEGVAGLRFHPYGTGESNGSSAEFTLETAASDANMAVRYLRERMGLLQVGLFGLRFGASVAVRAASVARPDFLLLWSPIVNLRQYARELLRLQLTKELVHQRHDRVRVTRQSMVEELEAGRPVDILGSDFSPALYRQMTASPSWPDEPPAPRVLWLARPPEVGQAESIVAGWRARGSQVELRTLSELIFWEEASTTLPGQFAAASLAWLFETFVRAVPA